MTLLHANCERDIDTGLVLRVYETVGKGDDPTQVLSLTVGSSSLFQTWVQLLYGHMPDAVCLYGKPNRVLMRLARWSSGRGFGVQYVPYWRTQWLSNAVYGRHIVHYTKKKSPQSHISEPQMHALLLLLKKHCDGSQYAFDDTDLGNFRSLIATDWQSIEQFARHNGVYTEVMHTAEAHLGVDVSHIEQSEADASKRQNRSPLPVGDVQSPTITEQLRALKTDIARQQVDLRALMTLYGTMVHASVDENHLLYALKKEKLYGFLRDMETILREMLGLEEGFMYAPPRNNRRTAQLRNNIYFSLITNRTTHA